MKRSWFAVCGAGMLCAIAAAGIRAQDRAEKLFEELTNAPGISGQEGPVRQIVARELGNFFLEAAADKKIPLQTELVPGYSEDGAEMQLWGTGTPSINFTVPVRYLHSFNGALRREDFDRAVELLVEILTRLDAKTVNDIKRFD